jgi:hypothetical protein
MPGLRANTVSGPVKVFARWYKCEIFAFAGSIDDGAFEWRPRPELNRYRLISSQIHESVCRAVYSGYFYYQSDIEISPITRSIPNAAFETDAIGRHGRIRTCILPLRRRVLRPVEHQVDWIRWCLGLVANQPLLRFKQALSPD